jgi:hypothetical protein
MTPTLLGRWQTRIVLLATIGVIVSAIYTPIFDNPGNDEIYFKILGYVALFGLGWDIVFILLQRLRWDRDWPAAFQVATCVAEGAVLWVVIDQFGLPGISEGSVLFWERFVPHYLVVWFVGFLWVQGPMRVFTLHWRFLGGRLV